MKHIYTLLVCALFSASALHAQSTAGLIAHWDFNGNANDATGNGHNGTVTNATLAAGKAGAPNTAYSFNGTSSKIIVPYQSDLNLSRYSICAVIKLNGFYTGLCQGNVILGRGNPAGPGSYRMEINDNNTDSSCAITGDTNNFRCNFNREGAPPYHYPWTSGQVMHTGSWHCIVGTFNDTVYKLYIDGVLQATVQPYSKIAPTTSTEGISIGNNEFGNVFQYPYWFNGLMDDLRLYNRALSAAEVSQYCNPLVDTGGHDTTNNDTTLAIRPLVQPVQLAVYPNPTNGDFTITGNMPAGHATVNVYNAVGQLVHTENITAMSSKVEHRVTLNGKLPDGMYMVTVSTGSSNNAYRVLVRQN